MLTRLRELRDLNGKLVLITGASSGLGKLVAYEVAARGANVVLCARNLKALRKVADKCKEISQTDAYVVELDVSDPDAIDRQLTHVLQDIGSVDILVNSAGFGIFESFQKFDMDKAENMFRVNVLGLMYVTQKIAQQMIDSGRGQIFNIASVAGKIATPKSTIYSATKFAVIGFSNALRLELRPLGIQVTTVNPGPMDTNFFKRSETSSKYFESVKFLALSPEKVAHQITNAMGYPRREINAPAYMEAIHRGYELFPKLGDRLASSSLFNRK
ncbi:SDR family NAD(P)-dependent oxidoreductase [Pediococcus damnosus]|uniref:Oxidoreductase, short-chain dehydrogenase/reductase family n=1 Tax=Pediococcus damnosus TaxID=51663 RepID=A0AAC9B013_9LACO|nr:SDR family oxidoreductase [Pediococcus damnosus]AMV61926.1 oxidoreductase, short-chain dehydrogenase/reductase family [Pediococcus damnosus]AMV68481.1 oxidoreductase, short-chain dehydrogenase/reductase family [Pediococcus damnosus]KJU74349.1 short-chain dehydrogenase [Pediococcus damnosus LMG 28219]PIO80256.1 short-chain dehydrogenase [Pediococcus damnosus]PJE50184.1 NAD(P)-dependent oxidoreductase [Pediococcus damnosus]